MKDFLATVGIITLFIIVISILNLPRMWVSKNMDLWFYKITNWIREHGLRGYKYRIYTIESPSPTKPQRLAETKPESQKDIRERRGQDYE